VVRGRVWLWPRSYVIQMTRQSYATPFRYWGKQGLAVKKGPANVTVLVAAKWRDRVSIQWGNAGGPEGARLERLQPLASFAHNLVQAW
jgi:hypothetical protein